MHFVNLTSQVIDKNEQVVSQRPRTLARDFLYTCVFFCNFEIMLKLLRINIKFYHNHAMGSNYNVLNVIKSTSTCNSMLISCVFHKLFLCKLLSNCYKQHIIRKYKQVSVIGCNICLLLKKKS